MNKWHLVVENFVRLIVSSIMTLVYQFDKFDWQKVNRTNAYLY